MSNIQLRSFLQPALEMKLLAMAGKGKRYGVLFELIYEILGENIKPRKYHSAELSEQNISQDVFDSMFRPLDGEWPSKTVARGIESFKALLKIKKISYIPIKHILDEKLAQLTVSHIVNHPNDFHVIQDSIEHIMRSHNTLTEPGIAVRANNKNTQVIDFLQRLKMLSLEINQPGSHSSGLSSPEYLGLMGAIRSLMNGKEGLIHHTKTICKYLRSKMLMIHVQNSKENKSLISNLACYQSINEDLMISLIVDYANGSRKYSLKDLFSFRKRIFGGYVYFPEKNQEINDDLYLLLPKKLDRAYELNTIKSYKDKVSMGFDDFNIHDYPSQNKIQFGPHAKTILLDEKSKKSILDLISEKLTGQEIAKIKSELIDLWNEKFPGIPTDAVLAMDKHQNLYIFNSVEHINKTGCPIIEKIPAPDKSFKRGVSL